ncbi:hypothetical protein ACP275_05G009400 [Erythranthe tilingii]
MSLELIPTPTSNKSADDTEIDTPPHTFQPNKPLSFTYGGAPQNHHRQPPPPPAMVAAAYKECMKNHAASLGGHSVDGCGEFMTSPSATATAAGDPTSLKCAACGCHRNFHRREPDSSAAASITPAFLDFRHPPFPKRFSLSSSPPPPPAPYEQPHMLFGLSSMVVGAEEHHQAPVTPTAEFYPAGSRKRFRSKFSQEQKEKMRSFSAEMGWKMHKSDEAAVKEFCREIGVTRGVLKVWMHNNKNTFAKKETNGGGGGGDISAIKNGGLISFENNVGKSEERTTDINGNHSHNSNGSSSPST